ncbi:protease inhibitor I9 family protein [Algoriphagus halophilus]|uniref:protease inhibitor I9 family protein n=1 Tax=Algoriphagus halophilus TaxID=226505 RepID=UPI00358E07FF
MSYQNKLWRKPLLFAGLSLGILAFSCQPQDESPLSSDTVEFIGYNHGEIIPGKFIVTLQPTGLNFRKDMSYDAVQAAMRKTGSELLAKYRISEESLGYVYGSSIEGFSVTLTDDQAEILAKDPSIKSVEPDRVIALAPLQEKDQETEEEALLLRKKPLTVSPVLEGAKPIQVPRKPISLIRVLTQVMKI